MSFLQNARSFAARLTLGQKVALSLVLVVGFAGLSAIAYWAGRPDYTLLFGRLDATDANRVVETLRAENIPYELQENGTAVYVPRPQVYDLRLRFAGEGLVSEGPVGYELFDSGTLGMTDFMQKVNYKRALEGELARTVSNVRQVAQARVHLVLPERSPFRAQQARPSASVVLQLAGGALTPQQIEGIASLVAGAVEGMALADVTVLDTRGTLLSNPDAADPDVTLTTNQLRTQRAVEEHLAQSGQSMLDRVLGTGKAVVRVAADLDFSRTVHEREAIDPESATVISEERMEETAAPNAENAANSNSMIRNYELTRTRERSEKSIGDVSYLTVSVILDYKAPPAADLEADEGEAAPEPIPYTEEELAEIEALVKNAVGFNAERGDRFAIHQTQFDTSVHDRLAGELHDQRQQDQLRLYLRYGLMVLALLLAAWLIRSAVGRVSDAATAGELLRLDATPTAQALEERRADALPAASDEAALPAPGVPDDFYTSKLSDEAKARLKAKERMYEATKKHALEKPDEAAELLHAWLAHD